MKNEAKQETPAQELTKDDIIDELIAFIFKSGVAFSYELNIERHRDSFFSFNFPTHEEFIRWHLDGGLRKEPIPLQRTNYQSPTDPLAHDLLDN